jgi:hypothetical protein
MENLVVEVTVKDVYGAEMVYPANPAAEKFAAISGKKTLTPHVLGLIESLGFEIRDVTPRRSFGAKAA